MFTAVRTSVVRERPAAVIFRTHGCRIQRRRHFFRWPRCSANRENRKLVRELGPQNDAGPSLQNGWARKFGSLQVWHVPYFTVREEVKDGHLCINQQFRSGLLGKSAVVSAWTFPARRLWEMKQEERYRSKNASISARSFGRRFSNTLMRLSRCCVNRSILSKLSITRARSPTSLSSPISE
jgi:hypothetical protein